MNGINLQHTIAANRRAKNLTQDDLAAFLGVTKASVSKWETGQSYPDITLLPKLAAYFGISIDELIGYEPQMLDEDIRKLYKELSLEFTTKPYEDVMSRCQEIVKKYYSCFNLLFQMGVLYINYGYYTLDLTESEKMLIVEEAKALFLRIRSESDDTDLRHLTLSLLATCDLLLGNFEEVIDMYKDAKKFTSTGNELLLAQAYMMSGKPVEAKTELQNCIYDAVMSVIGIIPTYINMCTDNETHFLALIKRTFAMIELWNVENLIPAAVINFYLATASGYMAHGAPDKALDILEAYTRLTTGGKLFPITFNKDDFFDLVTFPIDDLPFGSAELPRDEKSIKQSLVEGLVSNPALAPLHEEQRFKNMVTRLKNL